MTSDRIDYSERELYEITQLARLKFLGEEVAKQVMTEDEQIVATMACLKYIDLNFEIDTEGKFKINGKLGMVAKEGFVLPFYDIINIDGDQKFPIRVEQRDKKNHLNSKVNFVDTKSEELSKEGWDYADDFKNDVALVMGKTKFNHIDKNGNLISEQWWDYSWSFYDKEGFTLVKLGGKFNHINTKGELLSNQWWGVAYNFFDGVALVKSFSDGKCGFIDKTGELVISGLGWDSINNFCGDYAYVENYEYEGVNKIITDDGWIDRQGNFYEERP
jgi:hypothetical protein